MQKTALIMTCFLKIIIIVIYLQIKKNIIKL